ncbi:hypothetical protein [Candidatus Magnetobacterium casense]|uniref:Uncharacterized protein n=1 Tax=Candidatus Magnetobacterium casense TaxID=1455061 RepID=A0ABS6S4C6_9BACT|nr:hypothetical protein [Candidatus Magnetobacterium casensis]MBV6343707.1 hypothetical protein [Candidatus Magnetobacterium casensis]
MTDPLRITIDVTPPPTKRKTVAIYGFAPQTRGLIAQSKADEVWSLNNCYSYGLPIERLTRGFEMHELWIQWIARQRHESGVEYWNWILAPHKFPIYMHMVQEDFEIALADLEKIDLAERAPTSDDAVELEKWARLSDWVNEQKR